MPTFLGNNVLAGASAQAGGPYHIEHSLKVGRDLSLHRTGITGTQTYTFSWWVKPIWDHDNDGSQFVMGGGDTCYASINDDKMFIGGSNTALSDRPDYRMHCRSGWVHVVLKANEADSSTRLYVNNKEWVNINSAPALDNMIIANRSTSNNDDRFAGYIAEFIFQRGVANDPDTYAEYDDNGTWIPKDPSNLTFGSEDGWYRFNTTDPAVDSSGNNNTLTLNGTVISTATNFWTNHVLWLDTPTNNFCMFDVNRWQYSSLTDFGVNGSGLFTNIHDGALPGNMPLTSGKWYYEGMVPSTANVNSCMFGITSDDMIYSTPAGSGQGSSAAPNFGGQNVHWFTGDSGGANQGHKRHDSTAGIAYGSAAATEDIIGVAFDVDAQKIWVAINNTWISSGDPANGTNPMWDGSSGGSADGHFDGVFAGDTGNPSADAGNRFWTTFCSNMGNEKIASNFGQALYNGGQRESDPTASTGAYSFKYTPPSGFKAICTKNLPDVPITQPEKHVEVKHFTHNTSGQNIDLEFKPDLIWFHQDTGDAHYVMVTDSCTKKVYGMGQSAAATSPTDCVTSFNISGGNGFVLGADAGDLGINGENGAAATAYCWRGGGEPTATNDNAAGAAQDAGSVKVDGADGSFAHGTIRADKMSVNTVAGFSIVSYTGTGTAGTLPHGLGRDPQCVMIRNVSTDAGDNMIVWNGAMDSTPAFGQFPSINGFLTTAGRWDQNATNLTNNTFSVGTDHECNAVGDSYIAFVWAPIDQFSAFGHNHGHDKGGASPQVDSWESMTGFKPKIVMVKRKASSGHWILWDNEHDQLKFNPVDSWNYPNLQNNRSNGFGHAVDFYNNGFKIRNSDGDCVGADDFLWWAWADEPMGGANISPATGQ